MDITEHAHCRSCFKLYCTITPDEFDSCRMVCCDLGCGARYHLCKQSEHSQLCMEERVPCINEVNGCKTTMTRSKLGIHLEYCPASVMCCPVEWNRWPLHSQEKGFKMDLPRNTYPVECCQLDVALALRDQRMLIDSFNVPSRTRRSLRSDLTRKYPAAPIVHKSCSMESDELASRETSCGVSDDDDAPWMLGRMPPGLQSSICSQLYHATSKCSNSFHYSNPGDVSSTINEVAEKESSEEEKSREPSVESEVLGVNDTNKSSVSNINEKPTVKLHDILGVNLTIECISRYRSKPVSMYTFLCAQYFRRDEFSSHIKNVHNDIQSGLNGMFEQRCPLAYLGCTFTCRKLRPKVNNHFVLHSPLLESFGLCVKESGNLDPSQREENAGIFEQPFSRSRSSSGDKTTDVQRRVYSINQPAPTISTGLNWDSMVKVQVNREQIQDEVSTCPPLLMLPYEILQSIVRRLDSFSICNLSLTCTLLRDVCCSLLEERGLVTQVWEKKKINNGDKVQSTWQIAYNKWSFSTAFTPIESWEFTDIPPIGDHLKVCQYNKNILKWDEKFCVLPHDYAPMDKGLETLLSTRLRESVSVQLQALTNQQYQLQLY